MVTRHQCIFSKLHLFNMSYTILPNLFDIYSNPVFPHSQWMISKGLLCSGWTGSKWPGLIRRLALHLFINFTLQFLPPFLPVFLLSLFFISQVSISSIFTFTSFASFSMYLKFTKEYINRVWGRVPSLYDSTWLCCLRPKPSLAYFTVPCRLRSDLSCVQMSHKTPAAKKVIRS